MKSLFATIVLLLSLTISSYGQTLLPVGPFDFSSDSIYDSNFKEGPTNNGIQRISAGYLQLQGSPTGVAVFDNSATGGSGGSGGTSGSNANNDLSDFIISADLAGSNVGSIWGGFLLRLNDSEANGYLAIVRAFSPTSVNFSVGRGASLTSAGFQVFSQTISLSSLPLSPNTFYNFSLTLEDGLFSFNFANGQAFTSYNDPSPLTLTGQAGILLSTTGPFDASRLDNFTIQQIPEPTTLGFLIIATAILLICKKDRTMQSTQRLPASRPVLGRFAPGTDRATGSRG